MEISQVSVGNGSIGGDGGVDSYGGDGRDDGTFCTMVLMLCCSLEAWYGSPIASLDFNSTFLKLVPFSENDNFSVSTQCLSLQSLQKNITAI